MYYCPGRAEHGPWRGSPAFSWALHSFQQPYHCYGDARACRKTRAKPSTDAIAYLNTTMAYFFSTPVDIDIVLEDGDDRQMVDVKLDKNRREKAPLYMDGESVKGVVTIRPKDGKRLEHTGIKVQFIGTIGKKSTAWGAHKLCPGPNHISRIAAHEPTRNVLRSRQSLRIFVFGPGARGPRRTSTSAKFPLQL